MGVSVNSIPSVNLPFTDKNGRIHPIWYEFLRSFVASTIESTSSTDTTASNITAGSGLTGGGSISGDVTLNVGAGTGIAVNADDVSVDIANLTSVQAEPDDELMISESSNNNSLKKTRVRDVIALSSPGGNTSQIQYNNLGTFAGDSNFTTDGAGNVNLVSLTATGGSEILVNNTCNLGNNNNKIYWTGGSTTGYHFGAVGGTPYMRAADANYQLTTNATGFSMGVGTGNTCAWSSSTGGMTLTGLSLFMNNKPLYRYLVASITASTTRTQGQGALTGDINEISVCANVNDTVTLPTAVAARSCLVINNGAQTLQVFPASGDNLGAGLNTATTIAAGSRKWFVAYDTTNWEPVI